MIGTARSRSTDKRYYGVVEAIVTDNNDPDKEGRVKVKFPWFDEKMVSEWCRVRQLYAGNAYGTFFIPEVGDEVLVAFIHGDMRLPVILGGLYNGKDKPPSHRAQDKDQKMMRTKGNHEFVMDDTNGDKRISLKTEGGHVAKFDDKEQKVTIKSTTGHTLVLDDQGGKINLQTAAGQKVTLEDQGGKITIQTAGGQSITMDPSGVKITGPSTVSIEAASIQLGGSGATQSLVLGTAFMGLFNAHMHTTTAPGAPTSPPITPMLPVMLSMVSKTV